MREIIIKRGIRILMCRIQLNVDSNGTRFSLLKVVLIDRTVPSNSCFICNICSWFMEAVPDIRILFCLQCDVHVLCQTSVSEVNCPTGTLKFYFNAVE